MHAILILVITYWSVLINVCNSTAVFRILFWDFPVSRVLICCLYNIILLSAAAMYDDYNGMYMLYSRIDPLILLGPAENAMPWVYCNAKQKHLGCKKEEANQKQQLSDYTCN